MCYYDIIDKDEKRAAVIEDILTALFYIKKGGEPNGERQVSGMARAGRLAEN